MSPPRGLLNLEVPSPPTLRRGRALIVHAGIRNDLPHTLGAAAPHVPVCWYWHSVVDGHWLLLYTRMRESALMALLADPL